MKFTQTGTFKKSTLDELTTLKPMENLNKASLNYFFHLLQLKDKNEREKTEVEISMKALIQSWIYPSYYFLQTLAETIDREEAVKLLSDI